ncbi:unnamed protein product [Vicia faba]|uniref:Uncharacterized protein n=1 Tax=Vicia faba TaxID=3906 RepID=A0AAV1B4L1_VICFA|nr:unnamed protein product [Vicia faba]
MDVKALAKSKRDHTRQHNKKYHGNPKLKVQPHSSFSSSVPTKTTTPKEPFRKQQAIEKKTNRSGSSALPEIGTDMKKRIRILFLKSHADKTLEDFNEVLPWEFGVGLSSILSVRGDGIVSWDGDDNFVVQDKTIANQEASLISLNLHAIAQKLAKVDLSKRLFIEPDLLPSELRVEDSAVSNKEEPELDKQETVVDHELAKRMSKELNVDDSAADQFTSSSSCSSSHTTSISALSDDIRVPVNNDTVGKHSTFEAAAELELDMLLDTLDESKSNASFTAPFRVSSKEHPEISIKEPVSARIASITASLDDALDDLLEETSTLTKPNVLSRPQEEKPVNPSVLSSQSQNKSKVVDDFDSWFDTL